MEFTCPECDGLQDVNLTVDTYVIECEHCGNTFRVPRNRRKNKRGAREWKSCVNIRIGLRDHGDELSVGWTVQSAEKGNQYLEKHSVVVDVSAHPEKTKWYVAIFKTLQHIGDYPTARVWVKDQNVLEHLAGRFDVDDDDPRDVLKEKIVDACSEKFSDSEFCPADHVGGDIQAMLAR